MSLPPEPDGRSSRDSSNGETGETAVHAQSPMEGSDVNAQPASRLRSELPVELVLFLFTFLTYGWFFGGGGWNQNAHFDLTRALVERQTLYIDGYHVNSGDISWSPISGEWHAYINKPPGVSFLAAIPYAVLYPIERALSVPIDSWMWMTFNAWLVTVLTCGLAGALIPVVVYRYGARQGSPRTALAVALVVAFGTIVFPYATMLMAHVPTALFLLVAFVWLDERPLAAGISAGIAGTCYYLCIPAAAVLFLGALVRSRRAAVSFVLGGLPFGIALGVYHYVCFGSPFVTSLEVSTRFTEKGLLFGVFRLPSLEALWGLTFSEHRGLFFVSPVLLLAFAGVWRMRRRDLVMIGAIVSIFLISISGFNGWHGGSAFGPRYLLPIVPLLAIPLLYVRGRAWAIAGIFLAILSFGLQLLGTSVDPMPDAAIKRPVRDYLVRVGSTSVNPQGIDELLPYRNYPRGSYESAWASFNFGEVAFGAGSPWSVAPVALWVLAGSAAMLRRASV